MRIIAGTARGRKLISPGSKGAKNEIRPTSDRAREALFNILADKVRGSKVLDLFAGTDALGLEALSRGADSALFIDKGSAAVELIRKNIYLTGFSENSFVLKKDLSRGLIVDEDYIPAGGFTLVFLDPPYMTSFTEKLLYILGRCNFISDNCTVVAESNASDHLPVEAGALKLYDQRQYGETGFWLYLLQDKG